MWHLRGAWKRRRRDNWARLKGVWVEGRDIGVADGRAVGDGGGEEFERCGERLVLRGWL